MPSAPPGRPPDSPPTPHAPPTHWCPSRVVFHSSPFTPTLSEPSSCPLTGLQALSSPSSGPQICPDSQCLLKTARAPQASSGLSGPTHQLHQVTNYFSKHHHVTHTHICSCRHPTSCLSSGLDAQPNISSPCVHTLVKPGSIKLLPWCHVMRQNVCLPHRAGSSLEGPSDLCLAG